MGREGERVTKQLCVCVSEVFPFLKQKKSCYNSNIVTYSVKKKGEFFIFHFFKSIRKKDNVW